MATNTNTNDHAVRSQSMSSEIDLFELLLERRNWSPDFLSAIEVTEHDKLKDIDTMVSVLEAARATGQKIVIAPDFDMDGISSGVLGYAGLSELGFNVELHVPDYRRGHDLRPEDIEEIHEHWPDTKVILTCDGGVNSHEGIAAARAKGWTTLVTDHHEELEPGSTADVTVDPCRLDETYANRGICGAHVLYQVLEQYALTHQPFKLWAIRLLRLFAGLGTISDVMPVLYENRQLVRDSLSIAKLLHVTAPFPEGGPYAPAEPDEIDVSQAILLQLLRSEDHHPVFVNAFEGFAVILKAFAQHGKLREIDSLDEGFYGFYLAPAMNSPRRTEAPLEDCFAAFTGASIEDKLEAAHRIIENNERRKELTITYTAELLESDQPLAPWVYFSSAPAGMLGLLASQIMQVTGNPVVVVPRPTDAASPSGGSARAPEWFTIITALEEHGNPEIFAIGHQQACGVKVARAGLLTELAQTLESAAAIARLTASAQMGPAGDLLLGSDQDCDASLEHIDPLIELVRRIETLRPFGKGFSEPMFELAIDPLGLRVDRIGTEKQHLRLVTRHGLACLWWNAVETHGETLDSLVENATQAENESLRFSAKLQLNSFRGEIRLQAVIDQWVNGPLAESLEAAA